MKTTKITLDTKAQAAALSLSWNKDAVSRLSMFLLDMTGTTFGEWGGRLNADSQRALFGQVIGKGRIFITGKELYVYHTTRCAFGGNFDQTARHWTSL